MDSLKGNQIEITVLDKETKSPIQNVTVYPKTENIGAVTNELGKAIMQTL